MLPRFLPNFLTLLRIALIPVFAYFLVREAYAIALPVFAAAALTDFADGYLARRFHVASRFGAALDPVADKLNMLVATVVLAWQELLPLWLAVAIVARDVVIVVGVLVYKLAIGRLEISPSRLSKANTLLEFVLLLLVIATGAGWLRTGPWLTLGFALVGTTTVASGLQYAWLGATKAIAARRMR